MRTKKRFFLKAAGISLAKAAGISLAFVLAFAMAFAACDTGTSNKKPVTEDDDTDTGTRPTTPDTGTESTTYYRDSPNGNYVLTITQATSGAVSYSLAYAGTTVSSGTVTKGTSVWTFSSYSAGQSFNLNVTGIEPNLTFTGNPTITVNGNPIQIPTLYVNGYIPDSGQQQQPPPGIQVKDEATLRTALDTKVGAAYKTGVYRITSVMTLKEDLVVHAGQHIVVGGIPNDNGDTAQYSAGGPLFAITGAGNILNIGTWLKLESGASLSIAKGGAVNVTSGGTLYAKTGAAVGVGVNVSGRTVNIGTSGVSNLHIAGGGALHIEKTATLAVNNTTSISKVYLESTTSALTLEDGAELAIEVVTTPAVDAEGEPDAELEAARIIGDSSSSVIEIPATGVGIPGAPAAIGTVTVKGYDDTSIADDITAAVSDAADEATTNSTATVTTVTDTALQALLYSNTRVTYSGNTALSGIIIPPGTTLIISGDVNDQAEAIATSGTGKLEITGKVTTVSSAITQTILQSLVTASGGGTVVLNSSVNVVGALEVNQTLEIASPSVTLAFDAYGTISNNSTGTIVNKGTISTAQPNISVTDLGKFLAMTGDTGGTVEVTAAPIDVASGTLAIPKATTLKLSGTAELEVTGTLTVAGTLTNDGAIAFNAGSTLVVQEGGSIGNDGKIIETKSGTVLAVLLNNVTDGTIEVTEVGVTLATPATLNATATLKIADTKTLIINGVTLTVEEGATITATGTGSGTITNNGIIEAAATAADDLTAILAFGGKITASGQVSVDEDEELEIEDGTTLTITGKLTVATGSPAGKVIVKEGGTLVSANSSTGELNGELEVQSGGVYKDLNSNGATLWGNGTVTGTITWNAGAKGYIGGQAETDLRIGGPNDSDTSTLLKLATGTVLTNTTSGYTLAGDATVRGSFGISGNSVFHIASGTLTVDLKWVGVGHPGGNVPHGVLVLGQSSITGDVGASIVVTTPTGGAVTGGLIYIDNAAGKNFYNNSGIKLTDDSDTVFGTADDDTIVPAGTYEWDADADGSNTAGWKQDA